VSNTVHALAVDGRGSLYAGGDFTTAVARWDVSAWSALGSGTNATVFALAADGSMLYCGGGFTTAGGKPSYYIARWTAPNAPPVAEDDAYTTSKDTPLQVTAVLGVLANDVDPNGDPLTAVLDSGPSHGTLDLHADGSFTYTPAAGFAGLDTFTYHANDGEANSNVATVQITVTGPRIFLPLILRNY
jgi:VCBS repeat-containing protein